MVIALKPRKIIALYLVISILFTAAVFTLAYAKESDGTNVPIIMYHSILKDEKYHGRFVISPNEFEQDLKWLAQNGYTAVFINDIVNYVENGTPLPQKPVVLTFDDGYYNNYVYAYDIAKKYDTKIVVSVVGKLSEDYTKSGERSAYYSHLTADDMAEMQNSGMVEFQNHSYNMHTVSDKRNGSKQNDGESDERYRQALCDDTLKCQQYIKNTCGIAPLAYTYPFGSVSKSSYSLLKEMGFKATLSCSSGTNVINRDKNCLYMLKRYIRPHNTSISEILN